MGTLRSLQQRPRVTSTGCGLQANCKTGYSTAAMYIYAKYCPVAATTQVIGDYWTPLIIRELLYGTNRFNQLVRNLPAISRTLLANRLRTLERAGVIECERDARNATSYRLTTAGHELQAVIDAMSTWGLRWGTADPEPGDLNPRLVICMLKDRIRAWELPEKRVVMEVVAVGGDEEGYGWLVCERQGASMCFEHPGFDVDLWVHGDVPALYAIWLQKLAMAEALRCGRVTVEGETGLVTAFSRWFDGPPGRAAER
jgi:DNA-binding HxlR family transcriptional regulator